MESQFQLTQNGLAVVEADFNLLGTYGLMDDRVIAEFIRLLPYDGVTVDRAILPYGGKCTVVPNGASGSVTINPFRAIVGSRTLAATDALKNWRDIRSSIWVGGGTSLTASQAFASNSSGNARWDLVYANITPDANTATVNRKKKDPTTGLISTVATVTTLVTTVAIAVAAGAPSATPGYPAIPADGGGTFRIPLAYVRIPNGFTAGSTILTTDIVFVAPIAKIRVGGDPGVRPANYANNLSSGLQSTWGAAGTRPPLFLPTDLVSGSARLIAIDMPDGNTANWSYSPNTVVDDTVDWRNRYFNFTAAVGTSKLASDPTAATATVPRATSATAGSTTVSGMGQSFIADGTVAPMPIGGPAGSIVAYVDNTQTAALGASSCAGLYVNSATGKLTFFAFGTTWPARIFIWLDATTQFSNY